MRFGAIRFSVFLSILSWQFVSRNRIQLKIVNMSGCLSRVVSHVGHSLSCITFEMEHRQWLSQRCGRSTWFAFRILRWRSKSARPLARQVINQNIQIPRIPEVLIFRSPPHWHKRMFDNNLKWSLSCYEIYEQNEMHQNRNASSEFHVKKKRETIRNSHAKNSNQNTKIAARQEQKRKEKTIRNSGFIETRWLSICIFQHWSTSSVVQFDKHRRFDLDKPSPIESYLHAQYALWISS